MRVIATLRRCSLCRLLHQRFSQLRVRHRHPMNADLVQAWSLHQCGQALHEFHRCHHQMAGAIALGGLELHHHLPRAVHTTAVTGDHRAGDVAA